MPKPDPTKVQEQIDKQEEYFGDKDEDVTSAPNPEEVIKGDTEEDLEAVIGNKPEPGKPFSIAEEVKKDEEER